MNDDPLSRRRKRASPWLRSHNRYACRDCGLTVIVEGRLRRVDARSLRVSMSNCYRVAARGNRYGLPPAA